MPAFPTARATVCLMRSRRVSVHNDGLCAYGNTNSGQVAVGSVWGCPTQQIFTGKGLMHPFSIYNVYGHI